MKYFLLVSFFFLSFVIKAQDSNIEIIKSKVFTDEEFKTSLIFAKEDTNGDVFLVRNYFSSYAKPKGYYIEHYDKELNLLESKKNEIEKSELRGIYLRDSELVLLQFKYLNKEKKYAFVTLTSNKDTFNFIEKEILSFDRDHIKRYDYFGIRKEKEFNYLKEYKFGEVVESDNEKFIAINLFVKTDNNIDRFQITVFNEKFEKVFEHVLDKISTPENSKKPIIDYQNIKLDNNGNIYLLGKVFNIVSKQEKAEGSPKYKYKLFKINKQGQQQIHINNSNYFIDKLHLVIKNNNPYCVGFYKIKEYEDPLIPKKTSKKGVVKITIDGLNGEVLLKSYKPFPKDLFSDSFGDYFNSSISSNNLKFKNSVFNGNEDIVINCEESSIVYNNNRTGSVSYHYGDIISFKINSDGELIWAKGIQKKQGTGKLDYLAHVSFASITKNNLNYFFFNASEIKQLNDNESSFKLKKNDKNLFVYTINDKGDENYKLLGVEKLKNINVEVRFGVLLKENSILFGARSNEKPLLVKITKD